MNKKKIKQILLRCKDKLRNAVNTLGTYNPDKISFIYEEKMTEEEYKTTTDFLQWINQDVKERAFGSANYEQRVDEYLNSFLP